MSFVHSLVFVDDKKVGWIAPAELGGESPLYVSYVVPLSENSKLRDEYVCEVAFAEHASAKSRERTEYALRRKSDSTLLLTIDRYEVWFIVTPTARNRRRRKYIGKASHEDFKFPLVEIEPKDISVVDDLCEKKGIFIVGCDPFSKYRGVLRTAEAS